MKITSMDKGSPRPGFRQRRAFLSDNWFHFSRPSEDGGVFDAFVSRKVLDLIEADTRKWGNLETIGWLAGRVLSDEQGIYVYVTAAASAPDAIRERCHVETTPCDDVYLVSLYSDDWADLDKLGWWHSHPNLGMTRYSGTDFANQELWCGEEYQLGLLVARDGDVSRVAGFGGPDGEDMGIRAVKHGSATFEPAFVETLSDQQTHEPKLAKDRTPVWDEAEASPPYKDKKAIVLVGTLMMQTAGVLGGFAMEIASRTFSRDRK